MDNKSIFNVCQPYTMIGKERVFANVDSIDYVIENNIEGDIVEIGVWKGGSVLSMLIKLDLLNISDRTVRLYDTFSGMTEHNDEVDFHQFNYERKETIKTASQLLKECEFTRAYCCLEDVQNTISELSPYKGEVLYHEGDILKNTIYPEKISLLRLDTDWYESTKFELENFYHLVSDHGVIMIDDYGHWEGSKKATNEFIEKNPEIKFDFIDKTGIIIYKNGKIS